MHKTSTNLHVLQNNIYFGPKVGTKCLKNKQEIDKNLLKS